jgi:hypothetical protein
MAIMLLSVLPAMVLILYSWFEERRQSALQAQTSAKKIVELASVRQAHVIGEARSLLLHPVTCHRGQIATSRIRRNAPPILAYYSQTIPNI